jgi:hypothetical protein
VDFGTRGGPIIPPTPTPPPPEPKQPYREPAPVWEDQSNDIPNPVTYRYELPPPSRPRNNNVNIFDPNFNSQFPTTQAPTTHQTPTHNNIPQSSHHQQVYQTLVPVYIPNYGVKYYLVPTSKWNYLANNFVDDYSHEKYNKYNEKLLGKYNLKSKKYYKTYDKSVPKSFQSSKGQYNPKGYYNHGTNAI